MKTKLFTFAFAVLLAASVKAANTIQTVEQVTSDITLSDNVDYHISSETPFAATGSINITNTDHAVIILDNVKPSAATRYLSYIKINGSNARSGSNCQIKMYNRGAIILPYGDNCNPLTVYTEKNFEGESCNDFGTENSGGFMVTLKNGKTAAIKAMNNRIRSFKLKRGYMVAFSIKDGGYGYSRVFVAAYDDLEMAELPAILDRRISSYRVTKWVDASKSGAANFSASNLEKIGGTWTYQWGVGSNYGVDYECVPHMNNRWGNPAALGNPAYSAHIKTDNEPGNSADPEPATVDQVLEKWEALMATGKRLMTPSSHDGSISWFSAFLDSIDARGWRCEVLDVHSYWNEGSFDGLWSNWCNRYGRRPIWISEWIWGSSWGPAGIFTYANNNNGEWDNPTTDVLNKNREVLIRILNKLNSWDYIERYCYWNDERNCSKILRNGQLTPAGEFYAQMNTGVGYNSKYDYTPRMPRMSAPKALEATYKPNRGTCELTWIDTNGDLIDSVFIERRGGTGRLDKYEVIASVPVVETSTGEYKYSDTISTPGTYTYRIHTQSFNGGNFYSREAYNVIAGTEGTPDFQFGTINATTLNDDIYSFLAYPFSEETMPAIVFGGVSDSNKKLGVTEKVKSVPKQNQTYAYFIFNLAQWNSNSESLPSRGYESTSYIVVKPGNGQIGDLAYEAGSIHDAEGNEVTVSKDAYEFSFDKPFPEGVTPAVFVTPRYSAANYPYMWRVYDVTNKGFKVKLQRQKVEDKNAGWPSQRVSYVAITPGVTTDGAGHKFNVGIQEIEFTSAISAKEVAFGDSLIEPQFMAQFQTLGRDIPATLRTRATGPQATKSTVRIQYDESADAADIAISAKNSDIETVAWMTFSKDTLWETSINPAISNAAVGRVSAYPSVTSTATGVLDPNATTATLYNANGVAVRRINLSQGQGTFDVSRLPKGVYVVRTNANHTTRIIKK